jgi:hypothetical protein
MALQLDARFPQTMGDGRIDQYTTSVIQTILWHFEEGELADRRPLES